MNFMVSANSSGCSERYSDTYAASTDWLGIYAVAADRGTGGRSNPVILLVGPVACVLFIILGGVGSNGFRCH